MKKIKINPYSLYQLIKASDAYLTIAKREVGEHPLLQDLEYNLNHAINLYNRNKK